MAWKYIDHINFNDNGSVQLVAKQAKDLVKAEMELQNIPFDDSAHYTRNESGHIVESRIFMIFDKPGAKENASVHSMQ